MKSYTAGMNADDTFVREGWIYVSPPDAKALAKVHGVADIYAWADHHKEFE